MNSRFGIAGSAVVFALAIAPSAEATIAEMLEPQDAFRLEAAADPQIRPQGDLVAYVRRTPDIMSDKVGTSIWLVDTSTGVQKSFAAGSGSYNQPHWSPDGKKLAYISITAGGRSEIDVAASDGSDKVRITGPDQSPSTMVWSPDSTRIAYVVLVPDQGETFGHLPPKPAGAQWAPAIETSTTELYRLDSMGYSPPSVSQVFMVTADGGPPRQLTTDAQMTFGPLTWSPDGKQIAFSSHSALPWTRDIHASDVVTVDVQSGATHVLTTRNGPHENPLFSADGKWIAYLSFDERGRGYENRELYIMRTDGSGSHSLTKSLDRSIEAFQWDRDSRSLLISYTDQGKTRVSRLSVGGNLTTTPLYLGSSDWLTPNNSGEFSASDKGTIAYTAGDYQTPSNIWYYDMKDTHSLTRLNVDLLQHRRLASVQPLPVTISDGEHVQAWLMTPPDIDRSKKFPLILEIHGGPQGSYGTDFAFEYQRFAAAGYAVVYSNPRGSTSFGSAFANSTEKNFPGVDYDDLMAVIDAAIETGEIDEHQLFVTGASGGGLMTGWIVGKTQRFRAAVMQKPVTNWVTAALVSDQAAFVTKYWFSKPPWEDMQSYWARSPISLVGNIKTPTMLIVGSEDYRTPPEESEQFFTALRLRGIPTALLRIPGVGHQSMNSRPSQMIGRIEAIISWFDRYRS
jgi:dipeptidyl aminopeptidase/acylaminoacyl peptidase